jgi:hypothetical protein
VAVDGSNWRPKGALEATIDNWKAHIPCPRATKKDAARNLMFVYLGFDLVEEVRIMVIHFVRL